jgi:hypothetical protein
MMDLDVDDDSEGNEEAKCGCLMLRCVECWSAVLVEYSNGSIPNLLLQLSTSPRGNGIAFTYCRNCFSRTKQGLEGRAHDNLGQFRMARSASIRPNPWDTSDLIKTAALLWGEEVSPMLIGRVCLHLSWNRVSRTMTARDRVTSLKVSQAATGDAQEVVLSHLAGNWI